MFFYQITTSRCRAIFCSFFFSTSNIIGTKIIDAHSCTKVHYNDINYGY